MNTLATTDLKELRPLLHESNKAARRNWKQKNSGHFPQPMTPAEFIVRFLSGN